MNERHEAQAEHHHAEADQALRAAAVHDPAQRRPDDGALHLLERGRAGGWVLFQPRSS
jgi:hypothetical protein